jgi:methyl-accepting chemotaxis protein
VDDQEAMTARPRIPIGFQVTAGVGSLLLLTVLIAALALGVLLRLSGSAERLDDHYVPYATGLSTVELGAKGMANDERGFLLTGNAAFVDELDARARIVRAGFASAAHAAATPAERQAVASAGAEFERWAAGVTAEVAAYRAGKQQAARDWSLGQGRTMRKRYEVALASATSGTNRAITSRTAQFSALASRSLGLIVAALLVALVVGIGVTIWLVRAVLRPVHSLVALLTRYDEVRMV